MLPAVSRVTVPGEPKYPMLWSSTLHCTERVIGCAEPSENRPVASTGRSVPSTPRGWSGEMESPVRVALLTVTEVEPVSSR